MSSSRVSLSNGHQVCHVSELASTNAEAMRLALAGELGPLWVLADRQTAGRGRSGRNWVSAPGNLFASLLVQLKDPAPKAYQLALVAGVAFFDAVRNLSGFPPNFPLRLKWPNDLLIGRDKVGGILVESFQNRAGFNVVIGIGLNIADHPRDNLQKATHLRAHGGCPPPKEILEYLGSSMGAWLQCWSDGSGFERIRQAWLERAGPIGEVCTVNTGEGPIAGKFAGIDLEGALLIRDEIGRIQRYTFGDVTL